MKKSSSMPINKRRVPVSAKPKGFKTAFKLPATLQQMPPGGAGPNAADTELRKLMSNKGVPRKRMK